MEDQASAIESSTSAIKRKQEEKYRKKDPKSWDNVRKTLPPEDEAKFLLLKGKYEDLYNEFRQLAVNNQTLTKQIQLVQKECDHSQSELTKSVLGRARLENLCRELQKQNKQIKEENMAKMKEEEERRKEVSHQFADKLTDINAKMDQNKEKSEKLREDNIKMTEKLTELYQQFQKREEDIVKMTKQLELERQLSQATLSKMELELKAEKEIHAKEQLLMKSNLEKSEANCSVLAQTVKDLQDHIEIYKSQYADFEATMSKSTKVFDNFKLEIANMTKQVSSLESEAQCWKSKYQDCMKALVEMTETKRSSEISLLSYERKIEQLNKLCRQLQTDRKTYLQLLVQHGIDVPSVSQVKDEVKAGTSKLTDKEKELKLLKESLQAVQSHLDQISAETSEKLKQKTDEESSQPAEGTSEVQTEGSTNAAVETASSQLEPNVETEEPVKNAE